MQGIAKMPKVAPHIAQVTRANGNETIQFANGSRIEFNARATGTGRGRTKIDVLVFDEGQHLHSRAVDDLVPTTTASPNPLIFVIGTPPTPDNEGEHFTALRQEAIDGESDGTLYIEFSADRGCDPADRDQWRKANPSFPHRTSARAILRLKKTLKTPGAFEREALGIWDEVTRHQAVVKASVWQELADVGPDFDVLPDALAVDMSHDRHISIAACWREGDSSHIEEVWAGVDPNAAVSWIVQAVRRKRRMPVVIDSISPANNLIQELRNKRVMVNQTNATDMSKACGVFVDAIQSDLLTHGGQDAVDDALEGARKRPIGTAGGWGWNRKDETVNIAPLVAATLALFGASTTRRPSRSVQSDADDAGQPSSGSTRRSGGRARTSSRRRAVVM
ncbi:terminase [Prescottella equi]|uniref:terminase n=1 Tax=Rhodococcus hoagii TaxID=43767 RepID=UPI001F309E3C|nr:terminase [Prescottella equi]